MLQLYSSGKRVQNQLKNIKDHAGLGISNPLLRTLRDLVRTRKSLVEERTAEKNRVRAVLKRTDNAYDSELFGPTGREFLAELSFSDADIKAGCSVA